MKLIQNAYVDRSGAYYLSGGLVVGSQRITCDHTMEYWQQANEEVSLGKKFDKKVSQIPEALYVGRIPMHFGHFLLEGLPRLCDACNIDIPLIGHIASGFIPDGLRTTPIESIEWVIQTISTQKFHEIELEETYKVDNLYVSDLPFHLSHSCTEPWRMTPMIKKLVKHARNDNPNISDIEELYLRRDKEELYGDTRSSDPFSHISSQIARVSYAKKLHGQIGSSTHMSLFANQKCFLSWESRGDFQQGDRNQAICDIVKTFNDFS